MASDLLSKSDSQLSSDKFARLLEVSQGLSDSLEFELVLERVVAAARDLLGTDMSTLLLLDESSEFLRVEAHAGIDAAVAHRLSTPIGENLAGRVAATGVSMRSTDIALDQRSGLGDVCRGHIRSTMLVPLKRNGDVLGVLGVETREIRCFDDHDEGVLQLLADQAATAIDTARLYALEREQVRHLQALLDRINIQNDVMRRRRDAHDRLSEAALQGVGHQQLLALLTELVPAPMAMVNQFGGRLGAGAPPGDDRLEPLWSACAGSSAFAAHLARLRQKADVAPAAPPHDEESWRSVPVMAAGEVLGAIVVLDPSGLEGLHMLILEEAASIIAAELLRDRSVAEAEARAHGDLLRALMSSDVPTAGLEERAALLGHNLTEAQAIVAVVPGAAGALPQPSVLTAAGRRAAARAGLTGLYGTVDGTAVLLLSSADRSLSRDSVERWITDLGDDLRDRAQDAALHFGVSELPCMRGALRDGLAHARQAAAVCRLRPGQTVTFFEDFQLIATLIDITNDEAVERYIQQTIGQLEEYDGRKGSGLSRTLEIYLDCSGVARHAAKALYLHPHSLRYRLRRIAEIQGIDLDDPMERLTAHLALKLRSLVAATS